MKYINLISGPRNISTALMYSFAQRTDTSVVDEPFYACYLAAAGIQHPGGEEVLLAQSQYEQEVVESLFAPHDKSILFIKNMAHHLTRINPDFLKRVTNVFLIRDPRQILSSYAQVIKNPTMSDVGIEAQHTLFFTLKNEGAEPLILDSNRILENPVAMLQQLCEKTGIDFQPQMLHWPKGPKAYDGVWAPYWYSNVHQSTGFQKQPTSNRALPNHLETLHAQAQQYYKELLPFSLQP